jgi:hypothetical protein
MAVSSSRLSLAGSLERGSSPRSTLESFGVPSLSVCAPCPLQHGYITPRLHRFVYMVHSTLLPAQGPPRL